MPALAEIKKKPQRQLSAPKKGNAKANLKKPEQRGKLPPVELMAKVAELWGAEGMSYAQAYRKVFPHRKQRLSTASTQGKLLIKRYIRDHAEELDKMMRIHGLGKERLPVEMVKRFKAKTLREFVTTEVIRPRGKDQRAYALIKRNTVRVEDNATRMRATELLADVHGARKQVAGGGMQQNVGIIYVVGGKIIKKRQERIV
jgi:hypothetical protein